MVRKLILLLICLLVLPLVCAAPSLEYVEPTNNDGASITDTNVEVNVSITESNLNEVIYAWNETNYSIYSDSLILMMNFDNVPNLGESNGVVMDVSIYNQTIEVNNTAPLFNNLGRYNGAYQFNGSGMFYTPSYKPEIRTLMFWMNTYDQYANLTPPYEDPDNRYIFSQRFDSTETIGEWDMDWFSQPKLRIYAYYNNGGSAKGHSLVTSTDFSTNTWYHVTVTSDGSQLIYYVNGQHDSTHAHNVVLGGSNNDDDLFIGGGGANDNLFYFNGSLDEIKVWNRVLTADEVYQEYVSNLRKSGSDEWELYVNQEKNATDVLNLGTYTYEVYGTNNLANTVTAGLRTIIIQAEPSPTPEFSDFTIMLMLITIFGGFFFMRKKIN